MSEDATLNQAGNWSGGRIQIIDAARGLCLCLMVFYHLLVDLEMLDMFPAWLLYFPFVSFLQTFFACIFVLLAGVSSRFSRSNLKRGLIVLAFALGLSVVTNLAGIGVNWGILHLLGSCMVLYGLLYRPLDRLPRAPMLVIYLVLYLGLAVCLKQAYFYDMDSFFMGMLGFMNPGFTSADYFPILPWIFMFLFGTVFGGYIREGTLPEWFYGFDIPVLPAIGRKSIWIYLAHQPVLYGLSLLLHHILFR